MRRRLLFACILLSFASARAQTSGACQRGVATARLNVGGVDAGLFNNGNLFYSAGDASYDYTVSGGPALYAAGFWLGGTVGGEVRTAATVFGSYEFWPGPLDDGATLPDPMTCAPYDRVYSVTAADVQAYEAGGAPTADLAAWPVGLGADAVDAAGQPVVAASRDQTINLSVGERPVIYGSQTAFWVMNDVGNEHVGTNSAPLGVEVQVTAAAFSGFGQALDQSTLFRYRVVNRNALPLQAAYATLFVDTDIGQFTDERQGVDVARGMAYTYNAFETDPIFGVPPAMGYDFLGTGLGAHRYARNSAPYPTDDPVTRLDVYNTQQGLWSDGTPQRAFGIGYGANGGEETLFAFPADPVTDQFWSEENADGAGQSNGGGNKRSISSTPAFALAPGASTDVLIAFVFGQGADRLDSITQLRAADDAIQAAYEAGLLFPVAGEATPPSASGVALAAPRPNPTAGGAEIALTLPAAGAARVVVIDVLGREVAVLHEGAMAAGATTLRVPSGLAPGVYAVLAEAAGVRAAQRVTVTR